MLLASVASYLKNTLEFEPHPHLLGGVANYGIKLWGTNAAFFMPQGGVHTAPPHPPPPSAAAPPGVHAQVAQNGTVYYHQPPVRLNVYVIKLLGSSENFIQYLSGSFTTNHYTYLLSKSTVARKF